MSQSLYTAMGGISAAQSALSVISNNIANINTTGYKSSSVRFSDVFYTTTSSGTGASATTGGIDPMQTGLGVQVSAVTKNFNSGTWVATGGSTDLMIQGNGFFTVKNSEGKVFYTRAGDFGFDSDGDLVTSAGYKVLGTDNLLSASSSSTPVHVPQQIVSEVIATDSIGTTKISDLNNTNTGLTKGNFNILINGDSAKTVSLNVNFDENTTVSQLTSNLQSQIDTYLAANSMPADSVKVSYGDGGISFKVDGTNVSSLKFENPKSGACNFIANTGLSGKAISADNTYATSILDYKVNVKQVTSVDEAISNPSYSIGDDGSISATYSNGDSLSVKVGDDGNTYEFVYTTAEGVKIQGSDCNVDSNVATPANFVIQLATITNPDGLLAAGNNLYTAGPDTGDVFYSVGGSLGLGSIASGGLEASNVDLSSEFSNMILAQRAVQANSRVFTTTSDIMDTIVSMGR